MHYKTVESETYYIAYDSGFSGLIFGRIEAGTRIDTPLESLEEFNNEEEYAIRLNEILISDETQP
jgi:F420-0:gamma-glutamyl ligase-like protein